MAEIKKKKVVFVSHYYWPPHFGGELRIAIERLESLSQRGVEVVALTSGVEGFPSRETRNGIKIKRSPTVGFGRIAKRINRLIYWIWLYFTFLFEKSVDVLHIEVLLGVLGIINLYSYARILLWLAKLKKARKVVVHSLATSDEESFAIKSGSEAKYYRAIDKIVSVSPLLQQGVEKVYPESTVLSVYGIHNEIFKLPEAEEKQTFRQKNGVKNGEVVFAFLGSFEYRKGLDMIVKAFTKFGREHKWRLWLIGPYRKSESPYVRESEVEELIAPLKPLEDLVTYWGKIDERERLAEVLAAADVFLFPTRREGFGIAPLEAMATGLPVIVSRIAGVTDLGNVEGETGFYIEMNDQEMLEKRMLELSADPELRQKMGMAGNARINQEFGWEKFVDEWEQIYFGK